MSVLLLAPSMGLGGGIERYVVMIRTALEACGERVTVLPLNGPGGASRMNKLQFTARAIRVAMSQRPTLVLAMHPGLLPVLVALHVLAPKSRPFVALYGIDIWQGLGYWTRRTLRRWGHLELMTISTFSAGAVSMLGREPVIVRPALTDTWHQRLAAAARPLHERDIDVLTVFRLSDWRYKGLPSLLEALRLQPVRSAMVVGSGPIPDELEAQCAAAGVELRADVDDDELADIYGRTKMLVLATQVKTGRHATGEGFGIVLIEAQAAGAVVVAPRSGGSLDAFDDGVTGWRHPRSSAELAALIAGLLKEDRITLAQEFVRKRYSQDQLVAAVRTELLHQAEQDASAPRSQHRSTGRA